MPKLFIERPDGSTDNFEISEDSVTIGRMPENAVQIDDVACSRRHCQILRIASGFEVTDLKSRNGTKVNGTVKERHKLAHGDVIEIGKARITFREHDEATAPAGGAEPASGECFLVWGGGARRGQKIALGDRTTFGRKPTNTVALDDAMASSYHCEVTREAGGFVLRDMGSTNGSVVNGEPVSEIALGHGARIRLGKTVFIFVDPAVADFEQAIAAEEEEEAEWGMMRAQMDFDRVKRARRAAIVWVGFFILVLGGSAVFFSMNPQVLKDILGDVGADQAAALVPVEGNRISDFSFEFGDLTFAMLEGRPGSANVTVGSAHQGGNALQVIGATEEEGWDSALALASVDVPVVASRTYEISAWVTTIGEGTHACAGVLWTMAGDESTVVPSFTPWARGEDWSQVRLNVRPPQEAERGRLVVLVMGPGSARFDDVVFRETDEAPDFAPVRLSSAGYDVVFGDHGVISVQRAGRYLLWGGGLVALSEGDAVSGHAFCFRARGGSRSEGQARVEGTLLLPGGKEAPASLGFRAVKEGFEIACEVLGSDEQDCSAGLGFFVSREFMSEGATVSGEEAAEEMHSATDVAGAQKIILGGSGRRLLVSSEIPGRVKVVPGARLRVAFVTPAGDGAHGFRLVTDFSGMQEEARTVLGEARRAKQTGHLGDAMALYNRVINEFPFDDVIRDLARDELTALETSGRNRLAEAEGVYEAAKDFYDETDVERARETASRLVADYEGYESITSGAQDLVGKVDDLLGRIRGEREEEEAARLKERAEDFLKARQERLAELFVKYVKERYPGTAAAAELSVEGPGGDDQDRDN